MDALNGKRVEWFNMDWFRTILGALIIGVAFAWPAPARACPS